MAKVPLISVVDDDESVRESLDGLLRSVGFAVKVFASAEEFLNSDHLYEIDCLLLDVRLPGMNGIELHRRLVANHCEVPVVFITAHGSEERVRSQAFQNGAVDYLIKPLCEDTVLAAVHKAVSAKRHTQGQS
ncbi:MAG: response regulator [Candidatus Korobacteraceae bacterium]